MKAREVPGALALGLLASLFAHAAGFGNAHAMGGAYHELLQTVATAAICGFAFLLGALAWFGGKRSLDGSVLAARIAAHLPSLTGIAFSAAMWFSLGESLEGRHNSGSLPAVTLVLLAASWLLRLTSRFLLRLLAEIVVAVRRNGFALRTPTWDRRQAAPLHLRETLHRLRRFARPPPGAFLRA